MPWQWTTDTNGWQSKVWVDKARPASNKSQHVRSATQWWTCNHPECIKALKSCGRRPQVNSPKDSQCGFCGLAWNSLQVDQQTKVQSVKQELRAKLAEAGNTPEVPKTKTQARRQRAKKAAAAQADDAQVDPKPMAETDEPTEDKTTDTLPSPEEIKELETLLEAPKPLNEDWSPEAIVDGGPRAKAKEQVEDLKGELADCEAFLEIGDRAKKMGIDVSITKARITELKKMIEKADKKVPAQKATAAELALSKEKYLERHKEKGLRANKAAQTARTNFVLLQQAQQRQIDYWKKELQRTAEEQSERQDQWARREDDLLERHHEVLAEFDERASQMEDHVEENPAAAAAAPDQRKELVFFERVALDFDPDKLPAMSKDDLDNPLVLATCGNLHKLLSQWLSAGAAIPFTFDQVAQEAIVGKDAKELILRLLGAQTELWFNGTPAQDSDIVPRQAVIAVHTVLTAAKQKYDSKEEHTAAAKTSFTKFTEHHQKRRHAASPYGAQ